MSVADQTTAALRLMLEQFAIVPLTMRSTGQQRAITAAADALERAEQDARS